MRKVLFCLLVLSLPFDCLAKTKVTAVKDPGSLDKTYSAVFIDYIDPDYQAKKEIETKAKKLIEKNLKAKVLLSHELFLPTRKYEDIERENILRENGVDSLLIIQLAKSNYKENIVTTPHVNYVPGAGSPVTTYSTHYVPSVSNVYDVYLTDLSTRKSIWYLSANLINERSLSKSLCNNTIKELYNSGYFVKANDRFSTVLATKRTK